MDARGLKLHVSQIVIRNVLRAVDMVPIFYMVGGIACAMSRYSQRLGDIAANTVVVRRRPLTIPDTSALLGERYNSLLAYPNLATRLRHRHNRPTRSSAHLCPALSSSRRRIRANPIPSWPRFGSNDRAILGVQATA